MRASQFEFEQRFFLIGAIFGLGFAAYWIDHTNVAIALLHLFAPSLNPDSPRGEFWLRILFGLGALLVFLAAALRTWAAAYLRTEIVHDMSQHAENVVADGPYRYVRNPLYLANLPMAAGIGFLASRLGWVFMVFSVWFFVYRLIFREESQLLAQQGESYARYLKAVPRFRPSLVPRVHPSGVQPHWGQAFAGESLIWIFGLAVLSFALTLNIKVSWIVFGLAFAVYFIAIYLVKRRAAVSRS